MRKATHISRRRLLQGAAALGTLGYGGSAHGYDAPPADFGRQQEHRASKSMRPYIGAPTSRVDGRAKVTGAAKYAGEFNVGGLAHACMVESTIAKGRIVAHRHERGAARSMACIDVLTHENRPPMADTDSAYKDDVAPRRLAVPPALRRQDHVQRPADRAGRGRRVGDRALRGLAGARRVRRRAARHGRIPPA